MNAPVSVHSALAYARRLDRAWTRMEDRKRRLLGELANMEDGETCVDAERVLVLTAHALKLLRRGEQLLAVQKRRVF